MRTSQEAMGHMGLQAANSKPENASKTRLKSTERKLKENGMQQVLEMHENTN
jgi:hypothetical protein